MTTTTEAAPVAPPSPSRARRITAGICFGVAATAMLAFGGQLLVTGWTTDRAGGTHHVHDLAWGALEGILLLAGLLGALVHRRSRPSAVLQAVAAVTAMLVTMVLVAAPDPFAVVLALLVGGGALAYGQLRRPGQPHRAQLLLAGIAAVPLVVWAWRAAGDQRADADRHAELLGYTGVTAFALALLGALVVASLRRPGWRLTALSAAAAAAVVGLAGLLWPDDASSPGAVGGAALLLLAALTAASSGMRHDGSASRPTR